MPRAELLKWQTLVQILTLTKFYSDLLAKFLGMNCFLCYFLVFNSVLGASAEQLQYATCDHGARLGGLFLLHRLW